MTNMASEAWVAFAASELQKNGSWTGRIHIHKLLYLVQELGLANPPFGFVLYQYGPYSFDLDSEIAQMELYGQLEKVFSGGGYGPRYAVTLLGHEEAKTLDKKDMNAISKMASLIGAAQSKSLELQATCLWVERQEGLREDVKIISRVKHLKPKYQDEEIAGALKDVRSLAASFNSVL